MSDPNTPDTITFELVEIRDLSETPRVLALEKALERLAVENHRLRDGADDTPVVPFAVPTPGQWIARFLAADAHGRRDIAAACLEEAQRAARCFEMNHAGALESLKPQVDLLHRIQNVSAYVFDQEDGTLRIDWDGRENGPGMMLIAPEVLDGFVEKYNATVRELAEVARERTAAWQAYADVMGEHQAAEAQQRARAAAGATA